MIAFIDNHREIYGDEPICSQAAFVPTHGQLRALGYRSPREFIVRSTQERLSGV